MTIFLSACASLLVLGLVMGFSPTLYALILHVLSGAAPGKGGPAIRWMALGVALASTLLMLVFRSIDPDTLVNALRGEVREALVRRSVDLIAGTVFLIAAAAVWVRGRGHHHRRPRGPRAAPDDAPTRMLAVGFGNTLIGLSGPATMYVTGRVITAGTHHLALQVVLYAVFLTTLVGPYLTAAYAWAKLPGADRKVKEFAARLAGIDTRPLALIGLTLAGLVFLAMGILRH